MNVSIIVFSPSGHTLKTAEMIEKKLIEDNNVRLINITGKTEFLYGDNIKQTLEEKLGEYDLLFLGGPVYAGHIEHNIINTIRALPRPDSKHSCLAVPFVTFGGVHSSIALEEMGKELKRKKYKSLAGIKIASKHTLTTTYSNIIYEDKPGQEEEELISDTIGKIMSMVRKKDRKIKDQSAAFKYAPFKERIIFKILSQKKLHRNFKNISINKDKCIKCGKCLSVCPMDMFTYSEGDIVIHRDNENCILCAECFHNCPVNAIDHPYIEKGKLRLEDGFAKLEEQPSAIYGNNR